MNLLLLKRIFPQPIFLGRTVTFPPVTVALMLVVAGCATAPLQNFDQSQEKSQTYMDSKGSSQAAAKMLERQGGAALINFREDVLWGGIYYFGNRPGAETMPYCSSVTEKFNAQLTDQFRSIALKNFDVVLGQSAKKQAPLLMVVSFTSEDAHERSDPLLKGQIRMELDVRAQLLFLDPKADMQVVNAYPLAIKAVDAMESTPATKNWEELAEYALCEDIRDKDGKATSIISQILDTLRSQAVVARSMFEPVAVTAVKIDLGAVPIKGPYQSITLDANVTRSWSQRFGSSFTTYLAKNSGFAMNPFLPGQEGQFDRDSVVGGVLQLTRRSDQQPTVTGHLRKPRFIISVIIRDLKMDTFERQADLNEVIEYGCTVELILSQTTPAREVARVTARSSDYGKQSDRLRKKHQQISRYNYKPAALESDSVDHGKAFSRYIESYLNMIANSIAHDEDDPIGIFTSFRKLLQRN